MTIESTSIQVGGFAGDPFAALNPPATSTGCCSTTEAIDATACCGTRPVGGAGVGCCEPAGPAESAGCC